MGILFFAHRLLQTKTEYTPITRKCIQLQFLVISVPLTKKSAAWRKRRQHPEILLSGCCRIAVYFTLAAKAGKYFSANSGVLVQKDLPLRYSRQPEGVVKANFSFQEQSAWPFSP